MKKAIVLFLGILVVATSACGTLGSGNAAPTKMSTPGLPRLIATLTKASGRIIHATPTPKEATKTPVPTLRSTGTPVATTPSGPTFNSFVSLNCRSEPWVFDPPPRDNRVSHLDIGQPVRIVGRSEDEYGSWWLVIVGKRKCWVDGSWGFASAGANQVPVVTVLPYLKWFDERRPLKAEFKNSTGQPICKIIFYSGEYYVDYHIWSRNTFKSGTRVIRVSGGTYDRITAFNCKGKPVSTIVDVTIDESPNSFTFLQ